MCNKVLAKSDGTIGIVGESYPIQRKSCEVNLFLIIWKQYRIRNFSHAGPLISVRHSDSTFDLLIIRSEKLSRVTGKPQNLTVRAGYYRRGTSESDFKIPYNRISSSFDCGYACVFISTLECRTFVGLLSRHHIPK